MNRKDRKKRRLGGYTMAEALIVVALIGILAGIAIPSVIAYRRELKLTELDDNARTVYLAAQNNLAALHSAAGGELELGSAVGRRAAEVPSSAVPELDSGTKLQYVSTDVASTEPGWLVLPGSVDPALTQEGSCYLVEFDPVSGVVYGVFYTETGDGKPLTESVYHTICGFSDDGNTCRVRAGRNAFATSSDGFLLGYYGADGAVDLSRPDAQQLPKPKLKLTNAEELVLEVTAKSDSEVELSRVFYTVSVTDGAHAKTIVEKGRYNDGATNTVVLDTLKGTYAKVPENAAYGGWSVGSPFAGWVQDSGITPGADVTVTVTTWYDPASTESLAALPQSASVKTNSLFAAREGERVQVGYGRHLQNLDTATSKVDAAITAARQTREIDFQATGETARYYWKSVYGDQKLSAINNTALTEYDGQGRIIRNMNAAGMPYAGLFSNVTGMTLENIVLVDAKASGVGAVGALAGVAGNTAVKNCRVYLTAPYSAGARIQGGIVGGLVGIASNNVTIDGSFASTVVAGTNGGGTAGGLVGRAGRLTVTNSYAAGHLSGGRVGGLVGAPQANDTQVTIRNSYAAGAIANATITAGGLLSPYDGTQGSPNLMVENAYAAVDYMDLPDGVTVYGATPSVSTCTNVSYLVKQGVNDGVSVNGVSARNDSQMMKTRADLGLGAPFIDGESAAVTARPYNLVDRTQEEGPLKAPYPYPTLRLSVNGEQNSIPHYGDWLEAVAPPAPKSLVAYYESFYDSPSAWQYTQEYFCYVNGEPKSGLSDRTGAIPAEGYAFLSKVAIPTRWMGDGPHTEARITFTGAETVADQMVNMTELGMLTEDLVPTYDGSQAAYYAYALPQSALEQVRPSSANNSTKLEITPILDVSWDGVVTLGDTTTAWVNPLFGKAAYNGQDPGTLQQLAVRSLRHLNNITSFYGGQTYIQELDIDGAVYRDNLTFNASGNVTAAGMELRVSYDGGATWSAYNRTDWLPDNRRVLFDPIAETDAAGVVGAFNSTYDGSGLTIRHLIIGSRLMKDDAGSSKEYDYAGLFSRSTSGTVCNVNIDSCQVTGLTGRDANGSGVLMGRLSSIVKNCTVKNCTVTAQGSKAGGHVGGLVGYVNDNAAISGCTVEDTAVTGGSFSYNAGGLAGYIYKQTASTKVQDCAVKNVQVSNQFSKETASSAEKRGTAGGFVGCMKDNQGVLNRCFVIGTNTLNVSGASPYAGGFVGLMSNKDSGAVQNSGVRLEGKVKTGYDAQKITGGRYTGGFAGTIAGGNVTASYAAIGVEGAVSGGFAGALSGGKVTNSYAGGHTKSGKFAPGSSNVTGTDTVGGLVGLWSGGSLDTCYTTCAVSGAQEAKTDVFANTVTATISAEIPGCYALGEAFVNGAKYGKHTTTNAATAVPELPQDQRTETHPYDSTLEDIPYPYAPVKYATGMPVPHYGDWPYTVNSRPGFEWTPFPEEFEPANLEYLQSAEAYWTEAGLKLTIDTVGSGTTLDNLFARSGGTFSVSSDLGEVLTLKAESTGGAGAVRVTDSAGNVWEITPVVIATTPDGQPIRSYEFTIPLDSLPPYLETLNLGGFKQGDMIEEIKYRGTAEGFQPVEPFEPGDSVAIDGKFDDWVGYPHQVLVYDPGNGDTAGTAIGAAFGDGNEIYLHIRNAYPNNMLPVEQLPYTGQLSSLIITNLPITVEGDDNWGSYAFPWYQFTGQNYTGPGIYKLVNESWNEVDGVWTTEQVCQMECYLEIYPDGSQEIEMLIHLEAITGSEAAANQITGVTIKPALGGTLTIRREPPE